MIRAPPETLAEFRYLKMLHSVGTTRLLILFGRIFKCGLYRITQRFTAEITGNDLAVGADQPDRRNGLNAIGFEDFFVPLRVAHPALTIGGGTFFEQRLGKVD